MARLATLPVVSLLLFAACRTCPSVPASRATRQASSGLTHPLLDVEPLSELRPFRHLVQAAVNKAVSEGLVRHVSVYYRDLNNGPWFGVNEQEYFIPASLLKVPLMMAVFQTAEREPGFLAKAVVYAKTENVLVPNIQTSTPLQRGETYTLEQLLRAMIVDSDNDAAVHLLHNVDTRVYNSVYEDLGIIIPGVRSINDEMSVHEYATFFRILYNSSYLSRSRSEQALQLLASTSFRDGLVAGVPEKIQVAHKFGERGFADRDEKQVHDCGIVYHPAQPYVLCVMTRGTDFARLTRVVRGLSALVYKEVDKQAAAGH